MNLESGIRRHIQLWLTLLIIAIGINACRTKKTAISTGVTDESILYTSCYPIESITVPTCKLDISVGNKSFSLSGSIYIRPDSICYFRGKLGLEIMRGVIYRDSFAIVNYIDRVCYQGKNDYLSRITGYPVNPESLLLLFTADRCEEIYKEKFDFRIVAGNGHKIVMQGKNRSSLEMNLNADNRTIENIAIYNSSKQQAVLSAVYSNYTQYQQFMLPTVFDISTHDGKNTFRIKANFQQILFNQPQEINLNISSRYKVVVLQ